MSKFDPVAFAVRKSARNWLDLLTTKQHGFNTDADAVRAVIDKVEGAEKGGVETVARVLQQVIPFDCLKHDDPLIMPKQKALLRLIQAAGFSVVDSCSLDKTSHIAACCIALLKPGSTLENKDLRAIASAVSVEGASLRGMPAQRMRTLIGAVKSGTAQTQAARCIGNAGTFTKTGAVQVVAKGKSLVTSQAANDPVIRFLCLNVSYMTGEKFSQIETFLSKPQLG